MPAASAEKRACQCANKLLRSETATESPELVSPPIQLAHSSPAIPSSADESSTRPAPAPATFTISYTPLSISYPEPAILTAKLETDAIRVTRVQLADMLHQSYIHESEHGWKANVASVKERLQADYEKDMQDATTKFAEHEKRIRNEEFTRGFENGRHHFETQLASTTEALKAEYEEQTQNALADILDQARERYDDDRVSAFELGRSSGIEDEREYQQSVRKHLISVGVQVDLPSDDDDAFFTPAAFNIPLCPTSEVGLQTSPSIPLTPLSTSLLLSPTPDSSTLISITSTVPALSSISPVTSLALPVSNFLSSLFEPFETSAAIISDPLIPSHNPKPPLLPPPFVWSKEPSDLPVPSEPPLPTSFSAPLITPSFPICDLSDLCSSTNPWRSLQHRKGRDRRCFTQTIHQCKHQWPPHIPYPTIPYKPPPNPPAPLDWHADP